MSADHPESNVRILDRAETLRLLDLALCRERSISGEDALARLARRIRDIIAVKVAFVARHGAEWTLLAESGVDPVVPVRGGELSSTLERSARSSRVECTRQQGGEWTVVPVTNRLQSPTVLLLHGDWTLIQARIEKVR